MKKGILVCSGTSSVKNIGDYIQSVAQEQFIDSPYCFVERESLSQYESIEPVHVVMNAWYMWNPESFPPSQHIIPLYLSMHIRPQIADRMLSRNALEHLKRYEPIGARDLGTMRILQSKGVKSYFSGCLTLTLGEKYKSELKSGEIIFVDPYFELGCTYSRNRLIKIIRGFCLLIRHYPKAKRINKIFAHEFSSPLRRISLKLDQLIHVASFYHSYSSAFSDDILFNAIYINHTVNQSDFHDDNEKMEYARSLIRKYAAAKLVVSSRIHCVLPCVGVETPTIFINSEQLEKGNGRDGSSGRFEGLLDFMNTLLWTPQGIHLSEDEHKWLELNGDKISLQSKVEIRLDHYEKKNEMIERINEFFNE